MRLGELYRSRVSQLDWGMFEGYTVICGGYGTNSSSNTLNLKSGAPSYIL